MRSSRRIPSNNHFQSYDNPVAEAAKKRQADQLQLHLQVTQPNNIAAKPSIPIQKRNSGTQVQMESLNTPLASDNQEDTAEQQNQVKEQMTPEQQQFFSKITQRFMEKGLGDPGDYTAEEPLKSAMVEPKIETDVKLQNKTSNLNGANFENNEDIAEYEIMEMQTKQVSRIKMKFKLVLATSTLPKKMPETIVYWNRCETKINQETQSLVSQQQLDEFHSLKGVKLHDYPEDRAKVAKHFPLLDKKQIYADSLQEQFSNPIESSVYYSPEVQSLIGSLYEPRPVEGHIIIENPKDTDVFFNSKFESGNLKQAFIVPQPSDFDELTDEEAMIGDYLPKEEKEYLRSVLEKRREKKKETAKKSVQDSQFLLKSPSGPNLNSETVPKTVTRAESATIQNAENTNQEINPEPVLELNASPSEFRTHNNASEPQMKKPKQQGFQSEFNLYLQDDTHSDGSRTQWFYFSVLNIKSGTNIKINIVNMTKPDSSFQKGMQPFVFSTKKFKQSGIGWHRAGKNITYESNGRTQRSQIKVMDIKYLQGQQFDEQQPDSFKQLSTLSFQYRFKFESDVVYFAHCQPYTYSDYANYICKLEAEQNYADKMRIDHLCNSFGRNPVYCITITSRIQSKYVSEGKEHYKWQKFEYQNSQSAENIKPKKAKREEVSDNEEETKQPQANQNTHDQTGLGTAKQTAFQKSKFNQSVPAVNTYPVVEQQSLLQKAGRLSRIPEVQHDTESNFHPEDEKQVSAENHHFDLKPSFDSDDDKEGKVKKKLVKEMRNKFYKKCIVLTSRVHPGETQSSFLVEGLIKYLLSDEEEAREIREKFVFKIIPMLNPDGVQMGNSRSSLMGVDLNRRWLRPSKFLHPTIYYTKSLIKYLNKKMQQPEVKSGGVVLFTDIHGHNKNMDIFMYGCIVERDYAQHEGGVIIRSVADGVDRLIPVFSSLRCKFAVEQSKVETGRIVIFREFGIQNSYTLECSFHGSEYLQRTKQIYMALYSQDYMQTVNQRYQISAQRNDLQFDTNTFFQASADFIRGVNWSSKRKPLLPYWFRVEPKVFIDQNLNSKVSEELEFENELKELESRWRPTGNILDDGKTGMTEKYGGLSLPYVFDGPLVVDNTLEKVAKRKKEKADRELKRKQQEGLLKYSKMTGSNEKKRDVSKDINANSDIAAVSKPASRSRKNSATRQKMDTFQTKRKAKGAAQITESIGKLGSNQSDYDEEDDYDSGQESYVKVQGFQEQGNNQTIRDQTLQKSQGKDTLPSPSFSKNDVEVKSINTGRVSDSKQVKEDLLEISTHNFLLKSLNVKDEIFEIVEQLQTPTSQNRLVTLSSGIEQRQSPTAINKVSAMEQQWLKKGTKRINLWEPKFSNRNQFVVKVDIPAIDKRLFESQFSAGKDRSYGQSIKDQTLENFAKLSIHKQSSQDIASNQEITVNRSDSMMKQKRKSYRNQQESESDQDELKLPAIFPQYSVNAQNLILSNDPLVLSSQQYRLIKRVEPKTIEKHQHESSPFPTPKKHKNSNLFAPINAVYSQKSLMSNSGFAEKNNINFIVEENDDAFTRRKMTQLYLPSTSLLESDAEIRTFIRPRVASTLKSSPKRAVEMKNGFDLSPRRSDERSPLHRDQTASQKLKLVARPHIILKPLSEVDWLALQQRDKHKKATNTENLSENQQRQTLRMLQRVVGTLEIKKNKLMIGRNQLLPILENISSPQRPSPRMLHQQSEAQLSQVYESSVPRGQRQKNYKWPPENLS